VPLGTRVEHVPDLGGFAAIVAESAAEAGVTQVWVAPQVVDTAPTLATALSTVGIQTNIVQDRDGARDQQIGISLAARAVAETGSVLLDERTIENRAPGLMSLHGIVLIPTAVLIDSLDETAALLREIASRSGGGYASFVTGPSRTADIEMSLTVGVQGPGQVTVIFVDSPNEPGISI
jgi:L-lactate dehydrogenase complex protein LldG